MATSLSQAKQRVDSVMAGYQKAAGLQIQSIVGTGAGKVYEAWILCLVLEALHQREGFRVALQGSSRVALKSSPGPIEASYPHFLLDDGRKRFDVWTDVEFLTLSYDLRNPGPPSFGDYHELDLVVVPEGTSGRPRHDEIKLGVECKQTQYRKGLLREILGVRRELSLLTDDRPTAFASWPRNAVPAKPASCLLVYCSNQAVQNYDDPGETFGIDFFFEPLP